jgi:hypothetical protein
MKDYFGKYEQTTIGIRKHEHLEYSPRAYKAGNRKHETKEHNN